MLRALEAGLVVPVPLAAAGVRGVGVVGGRENASSLVKIVALEAGQTLSGEAVPSVTEVTDSSASSLRVEEGSVGTSDTCLVDPFLSLIHI